MLRDSILIDNHVDVSPSLSIDHAEKQWREETSLRQARTENWNQGRNFRLTDVQGEVVNKILA